ncbi:MAG TPA: hypothetical protein VFP80_02430 [Thermoanaerobaculia bacterium]|nr:hypothetical protein [Thermoanaerobaculia bacterium]
MYALLGIDAVLRITAALLFLFVGVPALARRRPAELDRMEWFWWCSAAAVIALTIAGQLLTFLNVFSAATLLLLMGVLIVSVRARLSGRTAATVLRDWYRAVVLMSLHTLEGRINIRRRIRRARRRLRESFARVSTRTRVQVAAWSALIAVAAAFRLYRPFVTANLGFSDTYVHLYLVRLLEQGRQVDPAWGPYPRGMHFLLMAVRDLTNVDPILLMNFFGAIVGVLMTLAVADAARRLARSLAAGILAGALFATMIGGASQYFLLGGSTATDRVEEARAFVRLPYDEIPETRGEFDVLLTVFQRQTATLPQELAIVFLFPAVMFLGVRRQRLRFPGPPAGRRRSLLQSWHLTGYLLCTAAIAAVHPGVGVPLVLLSLVTVIVARARFKEAVLTGAAGILLGSTWMLGYIGYPRTSGAGAGAEYYFPFLRQGEVAHVVTWVAITPFLLACVAIAVALLVRAYTGDNGEGFLWTSLTALVFTYTHVASRFGLPELVEARRNAAWLAMALAILLGVAAAELLRVRAGKGALVVLAALWLWRIPGTAPHQKLINYSGYGGTASAVISIERDLEPFTWTLVTYGQEFPMVLNKGFHLAAADFLDRYDPADPRLNIPTPYVFIAVEKNPHPFEINTWASRFSREEIQRRLQTWCDLYRLNHQDMQVYRDDENVRVYVIRHNQANGGLKPRPTSL